ncbi:MAG: M3 family metallopeptidase [Bacteroidales bacterium]
MNTLLKQYNTPRESTPFSRIRNKDFLPAIKAKIKEAGKEIEKIKNTEAKPDFKNTILALEMSTLDLDRISTTFFNLLSAESNDKLQHSAQKISPLLSDFYTDIMLDRELFLRIEAVRQSDHALHGEDKRLLEQTHLSFIRHGAGLEQKGREKLKKINRELSQLSLSFDKNCLHESNQYKLHISNKNQLAGLPEHAVQAAADKAKEEKLQGWVFTLQYPSYLPFMKYAEERDLRREMYIARMSQCSHNNSYNNHKIIKKIVSLRIEMAQLLGYETFADYVLEERMAGSRQNVMAFLHNLADVSIKKAHAELKEIQTFAEKCGFKDEIMPWDWAFYAEKFKKENLQIDDNITRPWFSLERAEKSVFDLASRLYGLTFTKREDIDVYHKEVRIFEVKDADDNFTGLLYLDYFPRNGKQSGAWMTSYREQHMAGGKNIRPHISLVFNFTRPGRNAPALLSFNEFTTLLHEFGHGLHGLLSQCKYASLSGTSVSRDFVELPSQFLENYAYEKEWLTSVALHHETGECMPDNLIDRLSRERHFLSGYHSARQIGLAFTDMAWHSLSGPTETGVIEFEDKAMAETQILPKVSNCATSPTFGHIFGGGYAAGYYGYKWAEVLDADAFELFREKGIFDTQIAGSFKKEILEKGSSRKEMDSYIAFRGRRPDEEALLKRSGLLNQKGPVESTGRSLKT